VAYLHDKVIDSDGAASVLITGPGHLLVTGEPHLLGPCFDVVGFILGLVWMLSYLLPSMCVGVDWSGI